MGGCRCTYRDCKMKSDGKTHMFHYPVFDKVRCHQWLVNAQRLDFLDLKVSQLKNRCVCQHHFKDESFMNFKRDKLTFEAVPIINGPFCDPSKEGLGESKIYPNPILVEDIENDFDINDKKSNFSLKYADFLTNNEFIDSSARYNRNNINQLKENSGINLNMPVIPSIQSVESVDTTPKSEQNFLNKRPKVKILSEKRIKDPINIKKILNKRPKVKILSEKRIKDPINIGDILSGKFEMISPSRPLSLPDKSNILPKVEEPEIIPKTLILESDIKPSEKLKALEVLDVQFDPVMAKSGTVQNDQNKAITDKIEIDIPPLQPKKSTPTKNKVTPERSAAIEKKRKFNMKLKDIIESCLDKLDNPQKNYEVSPNLINNFEKPPVNSVKDNTNSLVKHKTKEHAEKVVVSHLAENKSLPCIQEYTIAYLEERMKKMENTLLNKIAQNSQEIIDFKNTITKDSSQVGRNKRIASTQTNENESSYKKFLYHEISKYLSPSSNSIIYEELFINKFSCNKVESPLKKKRRRCI